jgi:hypothetical protein
MAGRRNKARDEIEKHETLTLVYIGRAMNELEKAREHAGLALMSEYEFDDLTRQQYSKHGYPRSYGRPN